MQHLLKAPELGTIEAIYIATQNDSGPSPEYYYKSTMKINYFRCNT